MATSWLLMLTLLGVNCLAQRSPYAGRKPIGFPVIVTTTEESDDLGNRFGEDGTTTTMRLPIEALGDVELVKRLSKLPIDNQPFWLLNWRALEKNRKEPQTYPQKTNEFIDTNDFNAAGKQ